MKHHFLLISVSLVVFFSLAIGYDYYLQDQSRLDRYARKIEGFLHQQESEAHSILTDEAFWFRFINPDVGNKTSIRHLTEEKVNSISQKPFSIFLFHQDSLLFWTRNETSINQDKLLNIKKESKPFLMKLPNGFYEIMQKELGSPTENYLAVIAIPIKYAYSLESNFLINRFAFPGDIPINIDIVVQAKGLPVTNRAGEALFYLQAEGSIRSAGSQIILFLLYLMGFCCVALLINDVAKYLVRRFNPFIGAGFLFLSVFGLRLISITYHFTKNFQHFKIFAPSFSLPVLNSSLGDLLINSVLLLWMMTFFHREFEVKSLVKLDPFYKLVFATLSYFSITLGLLFTTALFRNIVLQSSLDFDFNNILELEQSSFLAIFSAVLVLLSLFLFTHRMMLSIVSINLSFSNRIKTMGLAIGINLPVLWLLSLQLNPLALILISLLYLAIFSFFIERKKPGLYWLVGWLVFFSAYSSFLLFKYDQKKDKTLRFDYAKALASDQDTLAEKDLSALFSIIQQDSMLNRNLSFDYYSVVKTKAIHEQISRHFINYSYLFNNYSYELAIWNEAGQLELTDPKNTSNTLALLKAAEETKSIDNQQLRFWPLTYRGLHYLWQFEVPVLGDTSQSNIILFTFGTKTSIANNASLVYSDLLKNVDYKGLPGISSFDYAVRKGDQTLLSNGNPPEEGFKASHRLRDGEESFIPEYKTGGRFDLLYKEANEKLVLIGESRKNIMGPISLFSYLFVLLTSTLMTLGGINLFIRAIPTPVKLAFPGKLTLRNRIQLSVIALILGSFFIIGVVTVIYFKDSSDEYHRNRLSRKINAVQQDIQREIELLYDQTAGMQALKQLPGPISRIHNMDINLYLPDGRLFESSASFVYNMELIAPRMNMTALHALYSSENQILIQNEKVGELEYETAYVPLYLPDKTNIVYLGLPYKNRNLSGDVDDFMEYLLNAYVFLLIGAGALAITVANSITKPISKIGENLRRFKLGKNEPLEWSSKDELGELIAEYNRMIGKLDESTEKLKQSEREGAWREMAKQVAHEIKNPLTPMKLSIQYLLHAYKSNPEAVKPMLTKVSNTLIEQIDGLSRIASEFSNFAKMPKAKNETFPVNQLLQSIHHLYQDNENGQLRIDLDLPSAPYFIHADKGLLRQVLNNLVKNAIQAIPDDRQGKISIGLQSKNNLVIIQISDNGIGISDDMKEKVFSPNFTTKNSGMGLGLAIAKNMIDNLDGKIYFQTEVNVGTDFFIELPQKG